MRYGAVAVESGMEEEDSAGTLCAGSTPRCARVYARMRSACAFTMVRLMRRRERVRCARVKEA